MIAVMEFNRQGAKEIAKNLTEARLVNPYEEIDLASFNGIILSGSSNLNVSYNPADYSKSLITELTIARVPILGICFGMQFLADFYGGRINCRDEHGWTVTSLDTKSSLLSGYNRRELTYMSHIYSLISLPNDFKIIATTEWNAIAGFSHKVLPVYGVMWHPEKMHKRGSILFRNFEKICRVEHHLP